MKTLIAAAIAAFALAATGSALAETVEIGGDAPQICTLPGSWSFVSGFNGGASGQFDGSAWTIPEAAFASPNGNAVVGGEFAIRIRGVGTCNTAHTIRLQSSRGGLVHDSGGSPPAGFTSRRPVQYSAHWSGNGGSNNSNPQGPAATFTPNTPGQLSSPANYVVSGSLAPPGNRTFDLRLGLQRTALAAPLIAGAYSDTVTVTLALAP